MNNIVTVTDTTLVVEPQGLDTVCSFTSCLFIPWSHVRGATRDPGMEAEPRGWRDRGCATVPL